MAKNPPTIEQLKKRFQNFLKAKQDRPIRIPAILGDGAGIDGSREHVLVNSEISGLVHVRSGSGKMLGKVINNRVPNIHGLHVILEQDSSTPGIFRVAGTRESGAGNAVSPSEEFVGRQYPDVAAHKLAGSLSHAHSDVNFSYDPVIGDVLIYATVDDVTGWVPASSMGIEFFPTHASMWHDESRKTGGVSVVDPLALASTWPISGSFVTLPTYVPSITQGDHNGDAFEQSFILAQGDYRFSVYGLKRNDAGKLDWYIDGTQQITAQDWYSTSNSNDTYTRIIDTDIPIGYSGVHTLKGVTNGKNASSSGYLMWLVKYWFSLPNS
jgi:hypothetical protein